MQKNGVRQAEDMARGSALPAVDQVFDQPRQSKPKGMGGVTLWGDACWENVTKMHWIWQRIQIYSNIMTTKPGGADQRAGQITRTGRETNVRRKTLNMTTAPHDGEQADM